LPSLTSEDLREIGVVPIGLVGGCSTLSLRWAARLPSSARQRYRAIHRRQPLLNAGS